MKIPVIYLKCCLSSVAIAISIWMSRLSLGPTKFVIQWVLGTLVVMQFECKGDHSPPFSAEVKE